MPDRWLSPALAKDWHVRVQPAPPEFQGPPAVLNSLAGYVVGTAIGLEYRALVGLLNRLP